MTNMKANEQEQIAIYRIMKDAYKQIKIRTRLFYKLLSHMIAEAWQRYDNILLNG